MTGGARAQSGDAPGLLRYVLDAKVFDLGNAAPADQPVDPWADHPGLWLGSVKAKGDTSFDSLISDTDPIKVAYEAIKSEFGSDNTTIVYLRSPTLWTEANIEALESLHYALAGSGG
jgi:hypothetical protein